MYLEDKCLMLGVRAAATMQKYLLFFEGHNHRTQGTMVWHTHGTVIPNEGIETD